MDSPRALRDCFGLSGPGCWCSSRISPSLALCWALPRAAPVPGAFGFPGLEPNPSCPCRQPPARVWRQRL